MGYSFFLIKEKELFIVIIGYFAKIFSKYGCLGLSKRGIVIKQSSGEYLTFLYGKRSSIWSSLLSTFYIVLILKSYAFW